VFCWKNSEFENISSFVKQVQNYESMQSFRLINSEPGWKVISLYTFSVRDSEIEGIMITEGELLDPRLDSGRYMSIVCGEN
jgi:hypothetical protein